MAFVPLRNVGAGGLVPDRQPYDLEPAQFASGQNVQFFSGRIGKSRGYVQAASLAFQPTHVAPWFVEGSNSVIIGANNALYRYSGSSPVDVTASAYTSGYANSPQWQMNQIGAGFLANNGFDKPQYMAPSGTRFADIANWPSGISTHSLRPFLSFLVMCGYTDGSTEYPYTVRWGDEFDPTGVPGSYDITSTTNLAGENVLGGRFGKLIDSLPLAGTNIIYAERGTYAMSFIGAPLVFAFRELFDDDGIINLGAVCAFENRHFVVGRDDIYVHDGSTKESVASQRVKDTFFGDLADTRSVFVIHEPIGNEIWVCYADKNSPDSRTANRAWVWNYSNNAWTTRNLPGLRGMAVGPNIGGGDGDNGQWDSLSVSWDSYSALWSEIGVSAEARATRLFGAGHRDSKLYAHNETFGASGSAYTAFLEAPKIDLDAVLQRATQTKLQILRILPQVEGTGTLTVRVGSSDSPQGPVSWKTSKNFNIETDYKVDTRVTGRYLALRLESADVNGYWTIGGLDIDVAEVAER